MVSKSRMVPFVWNFIERLQQKSDHVGTCAGVVRILSEVSGLGPDKPCDRFILSFPYGSQCCKWEVIFDSSLPDEPPDFIFLNNDHNFLPDYDDLRCLHDWDHDNHDSLFESLRELLNKYKQHHEKQIAGTRVEFELFSLTRCDDDVVDGDDRVDGGDAVAVDNKVGEVSKRKHESCHHFPDSEVFVAKKTSGSLGPIQIAVKLPIDFSKLSDVYPTESGIDKVLAIVVYENVDGGNIITQICPSVRVERALRSMGGTPHTPFPLEGCLHDYIVSVTNQISDLIDRFLKGFEKRKLFVHSLNSAFSSFILEFDAISFEYVHMLVAVETCSTLLLTVEIPHTFPASQYILMFTSTTKDSTSKIVKDFPYSPRWSAQEMIERLKTYLSENVSIISKDLQGLSTKQKTTPLKN